MEATVVGRAIAGADDSDTWVCRPHAPGEIDAAISGLTVSAARRIGKAMWLELGDGPELGIHLGMSGRIVVDSEPSKWDRFALTFEDGGRLALHDKRRLGRVVLDPDLSRLGPDAEEITRDEFRLRRAPVARAAEGAADGSVGAERSRQPAGRRDAVAGAAVAAAAGQLAY